MYNFILPNLNFFFSLTLRHSMEYKALTETCWRSADCCHAQNLQATFLTIAFLFSDLTKEPCRLLGTASVNGESKTSMAIVVYHLNESRDMSENSEWSKWTRWNCFTVQSFTSIVVKPDLMVSLSSLTLLRKGLRPDQSPTILAC